MHTALHWAVKNNHISMTRLLLKEGADPNQGDYFKRTPLYFSCLNHNFRITKLLLKHHADPWSNNNVDFNMLCGVNEDRVD